jgi:hypothetical protein
MHALGRLIGQQSGVHERGIVGHCCSFGYVLLRG